CIGSRVGFPPCCSSTAAWMAPGITKSRAAVWKWPSRRSSKRLPGCAARPPGKPNVWQRSWAANRTSCGQAEGLLKRGAACHAAPLLVDDAKLLCGCTGIGNVADLGYVHHRLATLRRLGSREFDLVVGGMFLQGVRAHDSRSRPGFIVGQCKFARIG